MTLKYQVTRTGMKAWNSIQHLQLYKTSPSRGWGGGGKVKFTGFWTWGNNYLDITKTLSDLLLFFNPHCRLVNSSDWRSYPFGLNQDIIRSCDVKQLMGKMWAGLKMCKIFPSAGFILLFYEYLYSLLYLFFSFVHANIPPSTRHSSSHYKISGLTLHLIF